VRGADEIGRDLGVVDPRHRDVERDREGEAPLTVREQADRGVDRDLARLEVPAPRDRAEGALEAGGESDREELFRIRPTTGTAHGLGDAEVDLEHTVLGAAVPFTSAGHMRSSGVQNLGHASVLPGGASVESSLPGAGRLVVPVTADRHRFYSRAMELWTMSIPEIGAAAALSVRAEQQGWDGITFTDSQNLVGDPFVAVALGASATERLRFATGVTNAFTRHPAALANIAATVQETSGGRFVLGIGRGDTALFHLGRKPMPVAEFAAAVTDLQTYLANDTVDCDGRPSRLRFLDRCTQPKVPLDVAVSGPRMIELAAHVAERVTLAVGADPDRIAWALDLARKAAADAGRDPSEISFGAYVNVGCHPDLDAARGLIGGAVAAFAHFSSMPGSTGGGLSQADGAVVAEVGRRYDSNEHLSNAADHTRALESDFVDRFAVVGPPDVCAARLHGLAALGIDRFVITGPSFRADRDHARTAGQLLTGELLPLLREGSVRV
jgi:5,10-methylenetetrahydromethanopterin reductase